MFVTDLIRDTLTSLTPRRNRRNLYINIFGEMQLCDDLGLSQSDHTDIYSTFRTVLCRCFISYKRVKCDSMVNKEYIYIYVCVRERVW